jgi:hypothetical protein
MPAFHSSKQKVWPERRSSVILCFRATWSSLTTTLQQDGLCSLFPSLQQSPLRNTHPWSLHPSSTVLGVELQEPPSPDSGHFFRSSCSQGLSVPSLVKIGISVLELWVNMLTHVHTRLWPSELRKKTHSFAMAYLFVQICKLTAATFFP